jgi:hypothetical protein
MRVRHEAQSLAASAPQLPRATTWLILRASSTTLSTWPLVSTHLSVASSFLRSLFVDRFRSPSASSSASFFVFAWAF